MSKGFSNWKDAIMSFKKHELSDCHRESVEMIISLPKTTKNICEQLSQVFSTKWEDAVEDNFICKVFR